MIDAVPFLPVATLDDLDTLDAILAGYLEHAPGLAASGLQKPQEEPSE